MDLGPPANGDEYSSFLCFSWLHGDNASRALWWAFPQPSPPTPVYFFPCLIVLAFSLFRLWRRTF